MKTRVLKKNNVFYPQYKFLFFWRCFQEEDFAAPPSMPYMSSVYKKTMSEAIEYCKAQTPTKPEVVWESHPDPDPSDYECY